MSEENLVPINNGAGEIREYEKKFPPGTGAIAISGGGYAYFTRPTPQQWDEMQMLTDGDPGERRVGYARFVRQCFAGAFIPGSGELGFDAVCALEGPAWISGPAGALVNKMAGTGDRPTRFL